VDDRKTIVFEGMKSKAARSLQNDASDRCCEQRDVTRDLGQFNAADVSVMKQAMGAIHNCLKLTLKHQVIGYGKNLKECRVRDESMDWRLASQFEEAGVA